MKTEAKIRDYSHMTNEERATLIYLGGRKQRGYHLTDDELIEYYELLFKANNP